jgi:branched-chain amino acid transport system ATP-binding protein
MMNLEVEGMPATADSAEDAILALTNVESSYGPVKAIRGVSLSVRRGRIATILGSNGAGKTTILKTISGIIDPRRGSVVFSGFDITAADPARIVRRGISHVPEGREVFALLSVHDNLMMGAYTRRDRDAVARDLEAVYAYFPILRQRRDQDAGLLSGGQQQMLAIGRALMASPRLLLLDEPSMGLAPLLVEEIFGIVAELRQAGVTVLLVEQNAQGALGIADRAYVLETGNVVVEGEGRALLLDEKIKTAYLGL